MKKAILFKRLEVANENKINQTTETTQAGVR